MSLAEGLQCSTCGRFPSSPRARRCDRCGSSLNVRYDLETAKEYLTRDVLERRRPGLWKYEEILPLRNPEMRVSLGEGGTFLHRCIRLADEFGLSQLSLKDETMNPTGAFLDRGMSVEVSVARENGVGGLSCGSTGNLAVSLVAYAARAGIRTKVFFAHGDSVDVGKFYQILAYGPELEIVGEREDGEKRAESLGDGWHPVLPVNPNFLEGVRTTAFEISEQCGWELPDWLVVPMGSGGHISRIWKALRELTELGLIGGHLPRLVGVQTKGCQPIVQSFVAGSREVMTCDAGSTIALDIAVGEPLCGTDALKAIRESGGLALSVSDRDTLASIGLLAKREGVFVEPASATTIAALSDMLASGQIDRSDSVVCVVTGMGLKYPEIARSLVKGRPQLEDLLGRYEGRSYTTEIGRTKQVILQILMAGESYGYELWKRMSRERGIAVRIPSVYQHLSELRRGGLVHVVRTERSYDKRTRHYYGLTDTGWSVARQLSELSREGTAAHRRSVLSDHEQCQD
ncbi:MAG: threonine synthase [Candidatus Thorarchaeota archaeon]|nr:threonine synthase [Candidatus Thorarchaeota archaeon]